MGAVTRFHIGMSVHEFWSIMSTVICPDRHKNVKNSHKPPRPPSLLTYDHPA